MQHNAVDHCADLTDASDAKRLTESTTRLAVRDWLPSTDTDTHVISTRLSGL